MHSENRYNLKSHATFIEMSTCSLVYMTLYFLSANIPALFFPSTEPNLIASIGYIFLIKLSRLWSESAGFQIG